MSTSQIVTGDAVVLDLRPARLPTRALAAFVDLFVVFLIDYAWRELMVRFRGSDAAFDAMGTLGYIIASFGYFIVAEASLRGRTLGHLAAGLRVVRDDGGTVGLRHTIIRALTFWLVDFAPYTGFLAGIIASTLHPQGKRIGDMLAGTLVVRTRAPRTTRPVLPVEPGLAAWAEQLEMSRVTDDHIAAARYALQRFGLLTAPVRRALTLGLARQIADLVSPRPPAGLPAPDFLRAVVGEHRRRQSQRRTVDVGVGGDVPSAWR